jgi:hypothetical protein
MLSDTASGMSTVPSKINRSPILVNRCGSALAGVASAKATRAMIKQRLATAKAVQQAVATIRHVAINATVWSIDDQIAVQIPKLGYCREITEGGNQPK